MALANLSFYYIWKNIACNNNKFKISALSWNNEFNLPDGLYSILEIQDYSKYIIKKKQIILLCKFMCKKYKIGLLLKYI